MNRLERRLVEVAENDSIRADERALLGLLSACEPQQRSGAWWMRCPLHDEKTPSFCVREVEGVWRWRCHGCGVGGDVFDLVMRLERCTFREARRKLGAGGDRPVAPPPKRPEKPYVLACERRGCTSRRDVTLLDVVCELAATCQRGRLTQPAPGDIRWVCPRCEVELRRAGRFVALWKLLYKVAHAGETATGSFPGGAGGSTPPVGADEGRRAA